MAAVARAPVLPPVLLPNVMGYTLTCACDSPFMLAAGPFGNSKGSPSVAAGEQISPGAGHGPGAAPRVTFRNAINPRKWGSTFTSLKEPEYAWYFVGNMAFFMGMQMEFVLRGFVAYEITQRASSLGLIAVMIALPMLVAAPFAGVIVDRVHKGRLLFFAQTAGMLTALSLAALIMTDLIQLWHLAVTSLVTGLLFSFNMPARQALVPQLVPQHKLMNAISLQMGGMNLTRIIAPALGGVLIAPIGSGAVYLVVAAAYALGVLALVKLPRHGMTVRREQPASFRDDFVGGFAYIAKRPMLRLLIGFSLLMPLFGFPVQQMLPVFAEDVFHTGPSGLGVLAAATGAGGLLGAIISANMDGQPAKGRLMLLGGLLMGVFTLSFALAPSLLLGLVFLAAANIGQMLFMATNNSVIQASLPAEFRGRVSSVMMMSFGMAPLGVLPITLASDRFGPAATVAASSALLVGVVLLTSALVPKLRRLRVNALGHGAMSAVQAAALVAQGKMSQAEADRLSAAAIGLDD